MKGNAGSSTLRPRQSAEEIHSPPVTSDLARSPQFIASLPKAGAVEPVGAPEKKPGSNPFVV